MLGWDMVARGWDPTSCLQPTLTHTQSHTQNPALQADWDMVKRGWDAHVLGKAPHTFKDALTAVTTLRVRPLLCL